jgi:Fe-S oxidoreductase
LVNIPIKNYFNKILSFSNIDSNTEEIIAAQGTYCRRHIEDGTDRKVLHSVEVLREAMLK